MFGFSRVWCCDTEYGTSPDGRPEPRCLVAAELYTKEEVWIWEDELRQLSQAPFDVGEDSLFVAYSAQAELSIFIECNWAFPRNILDLFFEFRATRNGHRQRQGPGSYTGMIYALAHYGLHSIAADEKQDMRALAMRGGPYTAAERYALLDYCHGDVVALLALLESPKMQADLARGHPREILFRGRYAAAQARCYRVGIPLDAITLKGIAAHRAEICLAITTAAEREHKWGIYDGLAFREAGFHAWLDREEIKLPVTKKTKKPTTSGKVWEDLEGAYPQLKPLRQCVQTIDLLSDFTVTLDDDGYSRCYINPFGSITGRNQPSNSEFPFGWPKWMRHLMQPKPGWGLAYLDASGQEVWLAAALSGDAKMLRDYYRDIYILFAITAGEAPEGATAYSHPRERNRFKQPFLANNYGQTPWGLAKRMGIKQRRAHELQALMRQTYPAFYRWRQSVLNGLARPGRCWFFTQLGWPYWTGQVRNYRSMMNFPLQAAGSDWMRVVMIAATEAGLPVCAPAHDGFLITAPVEQLDAAADALKAIMQAAGAAMFGSAPVVKVEQRVVWPGRFDPGKEHHAMWELVLRELKKLKEADNEKAVA